MYSNEYKLSVVVDYVSNFDLSVKDILTKYGCSRQTLYNILDEYNVSRRNPRVRLDAINHLNRIATFVDYIPEVYRKYYSYTIEEAIRLIGRKL